MNEAQLNKQLFRLSLHTSLSGLAWLASAIFWIELRVTWWLLGWLLYAFILIVWMFYLVKALIFGLRKFGSLKLKSLAPLSILILSCALVIFIDPVLTDFYLRFEPHARSVILSLEASELEVIPDHPPVNVELDLPVARSIKMARDERGTTIFFTRYTVGFGNHSVGYTYRSDDSESKIHNPPSGPVHRKIKEHWFWGIDPFDWSLKKPAF